MTEGQYTECFLRERERSVYVGAGPPSKRWLRNTERRRGELQCTRVKCCFGEWERSGIYAHRSGANGACR